ncbi:MAG: Dephospho-CoA kinase [Chlamydiae bacterium]|nr:Dephospho-CoA kinase [Chlamydiota bacterium]
MLALKKVAITGGLSSGKSTVGSLFRDRDAYVLDTDAIVHQLFEIPSVQLQIIQLLGSQVLVEGKIIRREIAQIVFKDPEKLDRLEKILHPLVREEIERIFKEVSKEKKWSMFVVEIPLLFETQSDNFYDATLAVVSSPQICQQRYSHKNPLVAKDYQLRSSRQLTHEEKAKRADFVLYNNGNLEELKEKFNEVYSQIIQ